MSIEVMKQALEALDSDDPSIQLRAAVALHQAIEQAEKQEPVTQCSYPKCQATNGCVGACSKTAPVHASDISQKRVDETAKDRHDLTCVCGAVWVGEEMVCSPRKREWVGLTDEEVGGLTVFDGLTHIEVPILADFVRAIEAKIKEKNGG